MKFRSVIGLLVMTMMAPALILGITLTWMVIIILLIVDALWTGFEDLWFGGDHEKGHRS